MAARQRGCSCVARAVEVRFDPSAVVAGYNVVVPSERAALPPAAVVAVSVSVAVKAPRYVSVSQADKRRSYASPVLRVGATRHVAALV